MTFILLDGIIVLENIKKQNNFLRILLYYVNDLKTTIVKYIQQNITKSIRRK